MLDNDVVTFARKALVTNEGLQNALVHISKAIAARPSDSLLHFVFASLLVKAGRTRDAARAFGEAGRLILEGTPPVERDVFMGSALVSSRHRQLYDSSYGVYYSDLAFVANVDADAKRSAFKDNISTIEFETSSLCNRSCSYCPNPLFDRGPTNKIIDANIYRKVIDELVEINYDRALHLHGYSEPLADRGILTRIQYARTMLPLADIRIYTNGDYLTKDYLCALYDAGLRNIVMSIHPQPNEPYSLEKAIHRIQATAKRLGVRTNYEIRHNDTGVDSFLYYNDLRIYMYQRDYANVGENWGGIFPGVGTHHKQRTAPCSLPINLFIIRYNGNVMPCCYLVDEYPAHRDYVCGNIITDSIFDIYSGAQLVSWRNALFNSKPKPYPCDGCDRDTPEARKVYSKISG